MKGSFIRFAISCHPFAYPNLELHIVHPSRIRLVHVPTRPTSSGCMLHVTVHGLWNRYGDTYKNRAETQETNQYCFPIREIPQIIHR